MMHFLIILKMQWTWSGISNILGKRRFIGVSMLHIKNCSITIDRHMAHMEWFMQLQLSWILLKNWVHFSQHHRQVMVSSGISVTWMWWNRSLDETDLCLLLGLFSCSWGGCLLSFLTKWFWQGLQSLKMSTTFSMEFSSNHTWSSICRTTKIPWWRMWARVECLCLFCFCWLWF